MKKRITIQDIADALGLSRNTVSKAINNTGSISPETKELVFQKAAELGYKQFALLQAGKSESVVAANREIALFTRSVPSSQHLSSTLLDAFQNKISTKGYRLTIYILRDDVIASCLLPDNFNAQTTDAILVLELFDRNYTHFLCNQKIPTLFVDSYANVYRDKFKSDLLYMENKDSVYQLIVHLLQAQHRRIGFIGDHMHCHSFFQRWLGYEEAMKAHTSIPYKEYCILADDSMPYNQPEWLAAQIRKLPSLPDAFFCANDFLAICTVKALRLLNYRLPQDIKIAGFDNSKESEIIEPALTTVSLYGHRMGAIATDILLNRIKCPDLPYTITYVQTDVVYRDSTER